jgi:23S rRNA pseudouridine1911/1915/1917 synthase
LDVFVCAGVPGMSRSRISSLIDEGRITIEGKTVKPSHRIRECDVVEVIVPAPTPSGNLPQRIPLDILYEDSDVIAVNKPAGMVVHPAAGNPDGTLVNALLAHTGDLSGIGGVMRPGIVHRLDKGTSGIILVAKNDHAHEALSRQFAERTMEKTYLCVTVGVPSPAKGLIDRPIGRHPIHRKKMAVDEARGRPSRTEYRVLFSRGGLACVRCLLLTGRTHQIRVHLKSLNCPILLDDVYGGGRERRSLSDEVRESIASLHRPALHAWKLSFNHPVSDERISLAAGVPDDLRPCLEYLGWKA